MSSFRGKRRWRAKRQIKKQLRLNPEQFLSIPLNRASRNSRRRRRQLKHHPSKRKKPPVTSGGFLMEL